MECITSFILTFTQANNLSQKFAFLIITAIFGFLSFLLLKPKKRNRILNNNLTTEEHEQPISISQSQSQSLNYSYVQVSNVIYKTDNGTISDEEVPYLIQAGLEEVVANENSTSNNKLQRTEHEEDLTIQFMMNHYGDIQKHTDSFEDCYRLAYKETDLDEKIELLQQTISLYEKSRKWFYRTKGGMIYFQDFYEHQRNSRCDDFSYIDSIKDYLNDCILEKNYIIPEILKVINLQNSILQKDIYQYISDVSKSDVQRIIKKLETNGTIIRTKKSNSYLLTLNQ